MTAREEEEGVMVTNTVSINSIAEHSSTAASDRTLVVTVVWTVVVEVDVVVISGVTTV